MLRRRQPDLVLIDLMLPDLDGRQVIQAIRNNPAWSKTRIVVISAQDEVDESQLLNEPVILTKEVGMTPGELVHWLRHLLDHAPRRSTYETA